MQLITERELQSELGISRILAIKMRKQGMPHIILGEKLIRYDLNEVEQWLKASRERSVSK